MATTWVQSHFRFRNDDGNETGATWNAALDTNITPTVPATNTKIRVRINVKQTGTTSATLTGRLYVAKNGGSYAQASSSSTNGLKVVDSSNITDNEATTQQISSGGSGFVAGKMDDVNGQCTATGSMAQNRDTEHEFMLQLDFANLADGDYFDLRMRNSTSTLNTYSVTPRITVTKNTPPTIALNTADGHDFGSDDTPTLEATATDPNGDSCTYRIQIDSSPTFDSQGNPGGSGTVEFEANWDTGDWADEWDGEYSGYPDVSNSVTYNGSAYSGYMHGTDTNIAIQDFGSASNSYTMYTRFYLRLKTLGSDNCNVLYFQSGGTGGTTAGYLMITSAGKLSLWNSNGTDTQIDSDSAALTLDTWYRVEVLADGTGGAGHCKLEARINGVAFASSDTETFAATSMGRITFGEDPWDASAHEYYTDEFAVAYDDYPPPVGEAGALIDATSGIDAGFANTVTGGDTSPFNSAEKVGYTVQGGDALDDDTYYVRWMAKDDVGSNTWSSWSSSRSFYVGGSTSVTATPSVVTATAALQAPTITAKRNITTTADLLSATGATQAPSVSGAARTTADLLSATGSVQSPTISTTRNVTITPSEVTGTLSLESPTVATVRNVTAAASLLSAALAIQAPNVRIDASVIASLLGLTGDLPAATVQAIRNVTVAPNNLSATLTLEVPSAIAIRNATVVSGLLQAIASINEPTISTTRNVTATPAAIGLLGELLDPTIDVTGNVTINAATLALAGMLNDPSVTSVRNVSVQVDDVELTANLETPSITAKRSVTAQPAVVTATGQVEEPSVRINVSVPSSVLDAGLELQEPEVVIHTEHIHVTVQAPLLTLLGVIQAVTVKHQRRARLYEINDQLYYPNSTRLGTPAATMASGRGQLYKINAPQG